MRQSDQTPMAWNVLLAGICLVLFMVFAGFLVWNRRAEAAESKRLQQEAEGNNTRQESQDSAGGTGAENTEGTENAEKPADGAAGDSTPEAENAQTPEGISFWGDEFFSTEEELQHSYRKKVEQLLTENGYSPAMADKTLTGAGTLSMMKMAGVAQEDLDGYISAHQEAAGEGEIPVTETGIRDLTEEQTARTEADYIPVIMMGYYGGWNKDPAELVQQQQKILDTFGKNKDRFIIIGVRPLDGTVDIPAYEQTMKDTWGEHYISSIDICTHNANTYEGQDEIAQALYEKLVELGYVTKGQEN